MNPSLHISIDGVTTVTDEDDPNRPPLVIPADVSPADRDQQIYAWLDLDERGQPRRTLLERLTGLWRPAPRLDS